MLNELLQKDNYTDQIETFAYNYDSKIGLPSKRML